MASPLTAGCIKDIYYDVTVTNPVVQVIDVKKIQAGGNQPNGPERYRLVISDGQYYQQAMLASQLNDMVKENQLTNKSVITLKEFICNTVHHKRVVIVLSLDILQQNAPNYGTPQNVETLGTPGNTNQQQQQPQQQSNNNYQQNNNNNFNSNSNNNTNTYKPNPNSNAKNYSTSTNNKPTSYQAPKVNYGGGGNSNSNETIHPIARLNPYQSRWTIKARVTSKSELRKWSSQKGNGTLFNVDLLDESGEIRATMFNDAADQFFNVFEVDKVFKISKGTLKIANKKFSQLKNEYELNLDQNSIVEPVTGESSIPKINFNFVPISELTGFAKDTLVDVIGIVDVTGNAEPFRTKSGKDTVRRNITLLDSSQKSVNMTLWGQQAETIGWRPDEKAVIAIKNAKVSDFGGVSLGAGQSTYIDVNPDLTDAYNLRGWFDQQGGQVNTSSLSSGYSGGGNSDNSVPTNLDRKTFQQFKEEGLGRGSQAFFETKAIITVISHDSKKAIYYTACPNKGCNKKVLPERDYKCENPKCQDKSSGMNFERRYIINFASCDHSGSTWMNCFNDQAEKILGINANDLYNLGEQSPEFLDVFARASNKHYTITVKAKEEAFGQDTEKKVRYTAVNVVPFDFNVESSRLIGQLRNMGF